MFLDNLKPFLVVLLLFSGSTPLFAQEKEKKSISETGDKSVTSQPIEKLKFDKKSADLSEEQCPKIREGSSTVEKIAGLKGAMSVRNLTFKYFDKPLFSLTDYDYEHMKALKPICDNSSEEIAGLIFDNLKEKVEEAKDTRNNTVDWIKKTLLTNNKNISESDLDLFLTADTKEEVIEILEDFHKNYVFTPNF